MRIERIEVFGVAMPLVGAFSTSYKSESVQRSAVVRVTDQDGCIGLGNVDPVPGYSVESIDETLQALQSRLAPALLGMDASNIQRLWARMSEVGGPALLDAKAAIEMACVDLTARRLGVAVHTYLGGAVKERLTFNAWIGILPPEQAAAETARWQQRGFRSAKIKVGGRDRSGSRPGQGGSGSGGSRLPAADRRERRLRRRDIHRACSHGRPLRPPAVRATGAGG